MSRASVGDMGRLRIRVLPFFTTWTGESIPSVPPTSRTSSERVQPSASLPASMRRDVGGMTPSGNSTTFRPEAERILNFMFTPGDIDDRETLKIRNFVKEIYGKLVADKGYISKELFKELFVNGIQLVTKVRNNMKNSLMSVADKELLRKRALIESANDGLKNIDRKSTRRTPVTRESRMPSSA